MATLCQMIANRINSLRSTGPRSAGGRARSSRNSTTHGLSRLGATPPAELAGAIADRKRNWRNDYRPVGPAQEWHFERFCAESVRLDACECRILALQAEAAERAVESWDDDRAAAVAASAAKLADRPEVIQPTLLQSRHGVLWLLERWEEVATLLARCDGWTPEAWGRAMDLLGVPADARPGSGPWDLDPEDRSAAPGLELVRTAVESLRDRLSSHLDARDARARADAEAGLDGDESPDLRKARRYAADARRQSTRSLAELRRLQADAPRSREATPSTPPPRPVRSPRPVPPAPPRTAPDPEPSPAVAAPCPAPSATAPTLASSPSPRPAGTLSASLRDHLIAREAPLNRRARRALAASLRS